jgi:glycosyltransferase involved in cell wall biosynthesis
MPATVLRLRSKLRYLRPDCVVAFMHSSYVFTALALAGSGIPFVASEHTSARHFSGRPLQRMLSTLAVHMAALKTVPSQTVFAEHTQHFGKIRTEPTREPPVILCVGRFWEEKGHAVLLEAFAQTRLEFPRWQLRFAGDGKNRSEVEALVSHLGLDGIVEMPGMVRDIREEYKSAEFVVMPSFYESFGLVAAEALASGRAVVGFSDCMGARELIEDGVNGLLVEPGDSRSTALANALRRLMGDAGLRRKFGMQGPQTVERFALSEVLDQWESLVTPLLRQPSTAS